MGSPARMDSGGRNHHDYGRNPAVHRDKASGHTECLYAMEWSDPTNGHYPVSDLDIQLRICAPQAIRDENMMWRDSFDRRKSTRCLPCVIKEGYNPPQDLFERQGAIKIKFMIISRLFAATLILFLFVSCGPAVVVEVATRTPSATIEPTFTAMLTDTPICDGLCPEDSLTMTAAMGSTLDAIPSNTPPPWATIIPSAGDLGWGSVYGTIVDAVTGLPLEGATVTCEHFSYTSPYLCDGITTTNSDGIHAFSEVFFRDTDRITLLVEAPGYAPLRSEQAFFTRPELHANLGLFPVTDGTLTPTPSLMCTAPACPGGVLVCGDPNGCLGGCGAICIPATPPLNGK